MRKGILGAVLLTLILLISANAGAQDMGAADAAFEPVDRFEDEGAYLVALMEGLPEGNGAQAGLIVAWEYMTWLKNREAVSFTRDGLFLVNGGAVTPTGAVMSIDGASEETTYLHSWQVRYTAALQQTADVDSLLKAWNAQLRLAAAFTAGEEGVLQAQRGGGTPMQRTDEPTPEDLLGWYEGVVPLGYLQAKDASGNVLADMMYYVVGVKEESPYGVASYVFTRFFTERVDGTREACYFNSANPSVGFKIAGLIAQEEKQQSMTGDGRADAGTATAEADGASAQTSIQSGEAGAAPKQVKIREGSKVNVRRTSNPSSELVGFVPGGAVFECLSVAKNGWYEIRLEDGRIAFVSGKMASPVE